MSLTAARTAPHAAPGFDVAQGAGRFPDPVARDPWQAAGVPRQRRVLAAPARGAAARSSTTRPRLHANVHRGVHSLSQWATAAYEGARDSVRRFLNARSTREIVFVRGTTEAINLVANSWGRGHLAARRRDPDHLPRASRQHRAVADAVRGDRRAAARRAGQAERRARPRRVPRPAVGAHPAGRGRACLERARHHPAGAGDRASGARPRGAGAARRCAGGAAPARGRAGARLRLLCVLRPQGLRTDRHRRAVCARITAGSDATVAGWRGHDSLGRHRAAAPTTNCPGNSRPAPRTSRERSVSARHSSTSSRSAAMPLPRTSMRCSSSRPSACRRCRGCAWSVPRAPRPRCSRSRWTGCIRTISAPSSTARASRSGPGIIARCRSCSCSDSRRPRAPPSAATTAPRTSSGWSRD